MKMLAWNIQESINMLAGEGIGLFDTVLSREDYNQSFVNEN